MFSRKVEFHFSVSMETGPSYYTGLGHHLGTNDLYNMHHGIGSSRQFFWCADSSAKMRTLVLKSRKCELEISAVRPESRVCCASNSFRSVRAVIWVRGQGLGLGLGLGLGFGLG